MRWFVFGIFLLSSVLNFLDRQVLAALAPQIMQEFNLSKGQYGDLISVFSLTYAVAAPVMGLFIDRAGLNLASTALVGLWSLAGIATGMARGFPSLLGARAALGLAESGSVPSVGKANVLLLAPREHSIGTALNQVGLTLGAILAPLAGQWIATLYGWRAAFLVTGALGFLWIPLWLIVARRHVPAVKPARSVTTSAVLRDRRFWLLLVANMAIMTIYSLWVNWTTVYLVSQHGLTQEAANHRFAWIPQIFGTLGGLFGGWLVLRGSRLDVVSARLRASLVGAILALVTGLIPYASNPDWATAGICASFFAVLIMSVNVYALPLDYFGAGPAAFAVAGLTGSYGVVQVFFSSLAGRVADHAGFGPVLLAVAPLPLIGWLLLWISAKR